jgi:hypothetical protein
MEEHMREEGRMNVPLGRGQAAGSAEEGVTEVTRINRYKRKSRAS